MKELGGKKIPKEHALLLIHPFNVQEVHYSATPPVANLQRYHFSFFSSSSFPVLPRP